MNENTTIEKLSETGQQRAEMVTGGTGNGLAEGISIQSPPPNKRFLKREKCAACGKEVFDLMDGKYCGECYVSNKYDPSFVCGATHNYGINLLNESLSENDLLQVSGGINIKAPKDLCKHVDNEYTCRLCGKAFIRRDPTGSGVAMAPRPAEEIVYCDECLSKIHSFSQK